VTRLRLVGMTLQPSIVADDGETLTPLSVNPMTIGAADWPNVVEVFAEALATLQADFDAGSA